MTKDKIHPPPLRREDFIGLAIACVFTLALLLGNLMLEYGWGPSWVGWTLLAVPTVICFPIGVVALVGFGRAVRKHWKRRKR